MSATGKLIQALTPPDDCAPTVAIAEVRKDVADALPGWFTAFGAVLVHLPLTPTWPETSEYDDADPKIAPQPLLSPARPAVSSDSVIL